MSDIPDIPDIAHVVNLMRSPDRDLWVDDDCVLQRILVGPHLHVWFCDEVQYHLEVMTALLFMTPASDVIHLFDEYGNHTATFTVPNARI